MIAIGTLSSHRFVARRQETYDWRLAMAVDRDWDAVSDAKEAVLGSDPLDRDSDVYSHRLDHMVVLPPGWLVIVLCVVLFTTGWGHPSLGCRSRRHR